MRIVLSTAAALVLAAFGSNAFSASTAGEHVENNAAPMATTRIGKANVPVQFDMNPFRPLPKRTTMPDWGGDDSIQLGDPAFQNLDDAKENFTVSVDAARRTLLGVIDTKAWEAECRGDLRTYRNLLQALVEMMDGVVVPANVTDREIRDANEKFLSQVRAAYEVLKPAYPETIRELAQAMRSSDANAVRDELSGGWLRAYRGRSRHSVDW